MMEVLGERESDEKGLTKWQLLEKRLAPPSLGATVLAGGHEVRLANRMDGRRLVVVAYVDGWIEGIWSEADSEGNPVYPQAWFWRPMRSRLWPLKKHSQLKKVFGKKEADRMTELRTVAFQPDWKSAKSLVRHLKKHFPDLELKEDVDG